MSFMAGGMSWALAGKRSQRFVRVTNGFVGNVGGGSKVCPWLGASVQSIGRNTELCWEGLLHCSTLAIGQEGHCAASHGCIMHVMAYP